MTLEKLRGIYELVGATFDILCKNGFRLVNMDIVALTKQSNKHDVTCIKFDIVASFGFVIYTKTNVRIIPVTWIHDFLCNEIGIVDLPKDFISLLYSLGIHPLCG
jgi:hypothetical protein